MLATKRFFKLDLKIQSVFLRPSLSRVPPAERAGIFFPLLPCEAGSPGSAGKSPGHDCSSCTASYLRYKSIVLKKFYLLQCFPHVRIKPR